MTCIHCKCGKCTKQRIKDIIKRRKPEIAAWRKDADKYGRKEKCWGCGRGEPDWGTGLCLVDYCQDDL